MSAPTATSPKTPTDRIETIRAFGAEISDLEPIGAEVRGVDLSASQPPPRDVLDALEGEMAERGFLVFKVLSPSTLMLSFAPVAGGAAGSCTAPMGFTRHAGRQSAYLQAVQRPGSRHPRRRAAMA